MSAREILRRDRERKKTKQNDRAERRARRILRLPEVEQRAGRNTPPSMKPSLRACFQRRSRLGRERWAGWKTRSISTSSSASPSVTPAPPCVLCRWLVQRRKIEASPQDVRSPQSSQPPEGASCSWSDQCALTPLGHDACRGDRRIGK